MSRLKPPASLPILEMVGMVAPNPVLTRNRHSYERFAKIRVPHPMRTSWAACLSIACQLALSGCTPIKVRLGMKVYLDKTPVTSIATSLPNGSGIAAGEKSPLAVVLTEPDDKVLQTEGAGHGKVLWKDLTVTPSVVTANQKGIVTLPHDPRKSEGKLGHVTGTVPSHPDLRAELDIPVRCNYAFTSNFSGSSGSGGMSGSDGMAGSSGSMGSDDANNPSRAETAPMALTAEMEGMEETRRTSRCEWMFRSGSKPLLQASASAAGKQKLYLVDPRAGSLTVRADGAPEEEAAVEAREAPEVWERLADRAAATAPMDEAALMVRQGRAEASP
jgi:hypothetical protein